MISQNSSPKRAHYKFLPRSLKADDQTNAFRSFRVKAFYLKKLLAYSPEDTNLYNLDFSLISQVFRNKKTHKTLCQVYLTSFFKPYVHGCLKSSKNLQNYSLEYDSGRIPTDTIVFALRKLPAQVKSASFSVYRTIPMDKKDIYDIARSIRRLPKLQSFQRGPVDHTADHEGYVQKELAIYSRSVARLKDIKRMTYRVTDQEHDDLKRAMRRGLVYRGITGLELVFRPNQNFEQMRAFLEYDYGENYPYLDFEKMTPNEQKVYRRIRDELKERDKHANENLEQFVKTLPDEKYEEKDSDNDERSDPEERTHQRFMAICRMREEIRPFYRFELFPELKELNLRFTRPGYPLGSFVVDGFSALKNLENLKITIHKKSNGTSYLFRAFLKLPFLKKFSFSVNDLNSEEWGYFGHFAERQNKIEEFHLCIKDGFPCRTVYLQQNSSLESTIEGLKNHSFLKSLHLDLQFFSLEALSQGFSHLQMRNQLHTFKFKVRDDILTSQKKPWKRVEGLCHFLKNQKESLKTLHIDVSFALEDILITQIAEGISELNLLQELYFYCNFQFRHEKVLDYYKLTLQNQIAPELKKKLVLPEKWNPSLAKHFQRLINLETFKLNFEIICTEKKNSTNWFVELISILPSFGNLRNLEIYASAPDYGVLCKEEPMVANICLSLEQIKNIVLWIQDFGGYYLPKGFDLDEIEREINEKQARKSYFMFY